MKDATWRTNSSRSWRSETGQGRLLVLQLPDYRQRVLDVPVDVHHRVEDVPYRAAAVDDVRDPARYETERCRDPVSLADLPTLITEQREGQVVLARERGVPVHGVGTDADHLRARGGENLVAVPERARLGRAAGGLVLGVEVQDDH